MLHCGMSLYRASRGKRNVVHGKCPVYREFTVKEHMRNEAFLVIHKKYHYSIQINNK